MMPEDLLLDRVHLLRIELELDPHGDAQQDRKHADREEAGRGERQQAEQVDRGQRVGRAKGP